MIAFFVEYCIYLFIFIKTLTLFTVFILDLIIQRIQTSIWEFIIIIIITINLKENNIHVSS